MGWNTVLRPTVKRIAKMAIKSRRCVILFPLTDLDLASKNYLRQ
jgi:hypothetical protein